MQRIEKMRRVFRYSDRRALGLDQAGMTLIEIMLVLAILGGLITVLGSQVMGYLEKSRVDNAKIQLREIGKALDMYNMGCGSYPTTDQGLAALQKSPGEEACPNWGPEPYVKKEPKDPWNRPLVYESADGSEFTLKSLGKDKKEGGEEYNKDIEYGDL